MKIFNQSQKKKFFVKNEAGESVLLAPQKAIDVDDEQAKRLLKIYPELIDAADITGKPSISEKAFEIKIQNLEADIVFLKKENSSLIDQNKNLQEEIKILDQEKNSSNSEELDKVKKELDVALKKIKKLEEGTK